METCDPDFPERRCEWRYKAVLQGRFRWERGHGWIWLDAKRQMVTWQDCPGCGKRLPDVDDATIAAVLRIVTMDDVDFQRLQDGCDDGD